MTNVLIAEDDLPLQETLKLHLEMKGYDVRTAVNGQEALEAIDAKTPDILLLDLLMPIMDGYQVLEALQERGAHFPTLVMTNLGQSLDADKCLQLGATECSIKSETSLSELCQKIDALVN